MVMRYHHGLGVGHTYSHAEAQNYCYPSNPRYQAGCFEAPASQPVHTPPSKPTELEMTNISALQDVDDVQSQYSTDEEGDAEDDIASAIYS